MNSHDTPAENFQAECDRAARNIYQMIAGSSGEEIILAALRYAYAAGTRAELQRAMQTRIAADDRLNEVT